MAIKFANLASTTLASGITSTATTLTVGSAANFPTLSSGDYFYGSLGVGTNSEIVKVTAISGSDFTITRGQDGTTAQAWDSGTAFALRVVAAALDDLATAADTESVSKTGDTMTGALTLDTGTNGLPTINLSHSNSGADNFRIQGGIPGTSNGGFSIRDVDAGVNRFTLDSSGNATFAGKASVATTVSDGNLTVYANSNSVPGLSIMSDANHGMHILHRATEGNFSFVREVSGTKSEFLNIARATGNATFAGDVTVSGGHVKIENAAATPGTVRSQYADLLIDNTEGQIQISAQDGGDWASNLVFSNVGGNANDGYTYKHYWWHHAPSTATANASRLELRTSTSSSNQQIGGQAANSTSIFNITDAGNATFAGNVDVGTGLRLFTDGSGNSVITQLGQDKSMYFAGDDAGTGINALVLDMANAGAATFSGSITATGRSTFDSVTIDDDGSGSPILRVVADDLNPWAFQIENDSATNDGLFQAYVNNNNNLYFRARATGAYPTWYLQVSNGTTVVDALSLTSGGVNASGYINGATYRVGGTEVFDTSRNLTLNSRLTFGYNSHYFEAGTNSLSFKNSSGTAYVTINNTGISTTGTISSGAISIVDSSNPGITSGSLIIEGRRDGAANVLTLRAKDASAPTSALPVDQGPVMRFQGFDGTDFENMAYIFAESDATIANGDAPSALKFGTSADGSSAPTLALTLDSSQNAIFAGTLTVNGSAQSSFYGIKLSRSSTGLTTPDLWGENSTLVLGTSSSDERLALSTSGATIYGTITTSQSMASSPYIHHFDVSGSNTVGGGAGIVLQTSVTAGTTSAFGGKIEAVRTSSDDGSADLKFYTSKASNSNGAHQLVLTLDEDKASTFYGDIYAPTKIRHVGDTDTYLTFANNDDFRIVVGNSTRAAFNTSKIHFNQEGINQDFQVQSNNNTHALFVDAGNDRVGIFTSSPAAPIHIQTSHSSTDVTAANTNSTMVIGNSAAGNGIYNAIKFSANQQDMYIMSFNNNTQANRRMGFFLGSVAGDATTDERLSIRGNGKVGVNNNSPSEILTVGGVIAASASSYTVNATTANFGFYNGSGTPTTYVQMPASGRFQLWKPNTGAYFKADSGGRIGIQKDPVSTVSLSIAAQATSNSSYGLEVTNATSNTRFLVDGTGHSYFYKTDNAVGMRWDAVNSRLGVNVGSPSYTLDVRGNARIGNGTSAEQDILFVASTGNWQVGTNASGNGTSSNQFYIYDSAYRFTVQKGANRVGIGTNAPVGTLELNNGSSAVELQFKETSTAYHRLGIKKLGSQLQFGEYNNDGTSLTSILTLDGNGDNATLATSRTSGANATVLTLSDNVTGVQTSGFGTQIRGVSNGGSAISAIGFEAYGGTNNDTAIAFYTQSVAGGLARRMTISDDGNIGVGTATPRAATGYTNLSLNGSVSGLIDINTNGTRVLSIYGSGNHAEFVNPTSSGQMRFYTNNLERIKIDPSGHIVVNDSSYNADFRIESDGNENMFRLDGGSNTVNIGSAVGKQTAAHLNVRKNGGAIEFGHNNNSSGYYGTLGSYGNNGMPYIGFSTYSETNLNTFTTNGFAGNIIVSDQGNLQFNQVTNTSATGQTPVRRMTLDTSGTFMVGQSTGTIFNQSSVTGLTVAQSGSVQATGSGGTVLFLNRLSSDGQITGFYRDGVQIGGIESATNTNTDISVGSSNIRLLFFTNGSAIVPRGSGNTSQNGNIDLGNTTNRFRNLYLQGGSLVSDHGATAYTALDAGGSTQTAYTNILLDTNSGSGQIWKSGSAYSSWGGASSLNIYTSVGPITFHPNQVQNALVLGTTGNATFANLVGINKAVNSAVALSVGADATSTTSYGLEVTDSGAQTRFLVDGVGNAFFANTSNSYRLKWDAASGTLNLNNTSSPNTFAQLNIGSSGSGETRAIDINGSWSSGESKSISYTYGSLTGNMVGQMKMTYNIANGVQNNSTGSVLQIGRFYHGGDSTAYPVNIYSQSQAEATIIVQALPTGTTAANGGFQVSRTGYGAIHAIGNSSGTNGSADTIGMVTIAGNNGADVQGGIYASQNSSTGTSIAIFTTNNYGTGPQQTLSVLDGGDVIVNRGRLGVGTSSPSSVLHLQSNDSTTNDAVNMMFLTALSTGTTTTGFGPAIVFQAERNSGVNQNVGKIRSVAEVNSGTNISSGLAFETGTAGVLAEKMRLTYSGALLIGTTDDSVYNNSGSGTGINLQPFGNIAVARDGNDCMVLNRLNSNGNILNFAYNGSTIGSIGSEGSDSLYIQSEGSSGVGLRFHPTNTNIEPVRNGARVDDVVDLGSATARFRHLSLSGSTFVRDGTASNPAYTFDNDTDTGFYRYSSGKISVAANTNEAMRMSTFGLDMTMNSNAWIDLNRSGFITFYGTGSNQHGIGSRDYSGTASDDIRINSFGSVNINLDANNDNTSAANFYIGKHGAGAGSMTIITEVNGENGNLTTTGNVTAYGSPSDIRLKENIQTIPNALDKVKKLQGVTFNYKKDGSRSTGLIAQELQEVLPEAVYEANEIASDEKFLAVRYGNTVGLLVESIKTLEAQVSALTKTIEEMKNGSNKDK